MPAPRRRSISTAWCGTTTCASRRNSATCSSTWRTRRSGSAAATPSRSICVSGCAALQLPEGSTLQVVEVPPGPPVLATLLAEIYGPDAQTRRAVAEEVKALFKSVPLHRRRDRLLRPSAPAAAHQHRPGRTRIFRRRAKRRLRHDPGAVRRRAGRLFAPRRGARSDRDPHRLAEARSELGRQAGLDAGAGQYAARQQDRGRTRPGGARADGVRLAGAVPPRRAFRRHGHGRTGRRL